MRHLKRNEGFTLIELVVSIGTAAVVMAAAASFLLMATRTQRDIRDAAQEQQTIRIVLTMLENLATEGTIKSISSTENGWELQGESDAEGNPTILLSYDSETDVLSNGSNPLLSGLKDATAEVQGQLLNFTFVTRHGSYSTSTYCRFGLEGGEDDIGKGKVEAIVRPGATIEQVFDSVTSVSADRFAFLATLCKEYGSTGKIKNPISGDDSRYYSEWYIEGYKNGWNSSTPWCACFLSWAAQGITGAPRFADVDVGYKWFNDNNKFQTSAPTPGDYIFFDWEAGRTNTNDTPHDPDHVGAVLYVSGGTVYTIEGNSGGRVAIRSYALDDQRILGYGVLPW